MDETSKKAFEITKNVTSSIADTLADVRSGGLVGKLKTEIKGQQKIIDDYTKIINEQDEVYEIVKKYKKALEEIVVIQPIACDGEHQGDYACDRHKEIAEQALKEEE